MATTRFGHLDDFTLKNSKVGIGTSDPTEALEVIGGSRTKDIEVTGIATLTSYEGFQNKKTSYNTENIDIAGGESGTLSGEIVIGAGLTMSVGTGATTGQGSVKSLKVSNTFIPPIGGTNDRPSAPKPGAIYYNKDFKTIEYWDGNFWRQVDNTTTSGRAVFGGGRTPNHTTSMESFQIHTLGNTVSFGDLQNNSTYKLPNSSKVRGIFSGGYEPSPTHDTNIINYITIASAGDAIDFGDLVTDSGIASGASSSTRGLQFGGWVAPGTNTNVIQYIEMSTTGNSVDFGDTMSALRGQGAANSTTRAIIAGGAEASSPYPVVSTIEYVTLSSLGNSKDFGELTVARRIDEQNASSSVRGLFMGAGWASGAYHDTIDFVTIASTGNAIDFGKLTRLNELPATCSSQTRGLSIGGRNHPVYFHTIEYVTIASAADAVNFGDLSDDRHAHTAVSDSHGGLGGF